MKRKSFWKRIRFKYKFSFFNESMLEEVWSFRLSKLSVFIYIFLFAVFLISITSVMIILTPIRNYLPGYLDVEIRKEILQNALMTDSLAERITIQSRYLDNLTAILKGEIDLDSLQNITSISHSKTDYNIPISEREDSFIKQFREIATTTLKMINETDN